jgi:hypothetical protein
VTDVGGDAVQPGGETGGILERGELLMGPKKGLLGQIVRDGRIANDAAYVSVDGLSVGGQLLGNFGMRISHCDCLDGSLAQFSVQG